MAEDLKEVHRLLDQAEGAFLKRDVEGIRGSMDRMTRYLRKRGYGRK